MASILPGYEYDIFISYRHNDNRSGWVTEFVKALQEELATTIKAPILIGAPDFSQHQTQLKLA